jgi:hypothetical protein
VDGKGREEGFDVPRRTYPTGLPVEVAPVGIFLLDREDFPGTAPFLHSPFAAKGGLAGVEGAEPDELVAAVFGGEAVEGLGFVLAYARGEAVGAADVERAELSAGYDVAVEGHGLRMADLEQIGNISPYEMGPGIRRDERSGGGRAWG